MKHVANSSFLSKLTFILAVILLTSFEQKALAQQVITIQQAVENTLKNNLTIKQAEFNAAITDENLRQSKNALLPSLNGRANQGMGWGRNNLGNTGIFQNTQNYSLNVDASVGIDLFAGFTKVNQIKQNRLLLDADKTAVEKVKNDLILQVVTSYMQILFNKDLLTASNQQLTVAKQTADREKALLDAGNKTLADLSQAKSAVATAELNVTNAENSLAISYLTLNQLMELPAENRFEVQAPAISGDFQVQGSNNVSEIYKAALNSFPDVKLANLRTQAAAKEIDIARGAYYPRLSMSAGYGTGYFYSYNLPATQSNQAFWSQFDNNQSKNVGMTLSIPIFNGYSARSGLRRAKISYQNTTVQEQITKNNLNKVVSQAVVDLRAAQARYQSTQNAFNAQKDAFYVVEQRYNVGLVNSLDFSTAQTNRNKAEIDMIQAKYDLIFRAKVIDYYLGKQIVF